MTTTEPCLHGIHSVCWNLTKAGRLGVGKRLGGHQRDIPCRMLLRSEKRHKKRQGEREMFLIKVIIFRSNCYIYCSPTSQAGHHQLNGNRQYTFLFCFVSMHVFCFFSFNYPYWYPYGFHLIFSSTFCSGGGVRKCLGGHLVPFQGCCRALWVTTQCLPASSDTTTSGDTLLHSRVQEGS